MSNRIPELVNIDVDNQILRTFILFVQTADTILKYSDAQYYKRIRLSVIKHTVLRILAANGGTMTHSQIADWTFRERHSITTLVSRLKREGFVKTERINKDRRYSNVTLTTKGYEVLKQSMPVSIDIVKQVMSSMSEDDASKFEQSLRLLRSNARDGLVTLIESDDT